MGEHDQDQDDAAEPARPPLDAEQAREATAGLREAMDDVRRPVTVLAARVRDAHAARVRGRSVTAVGRRTASGFSRSKDLGDPRSYRAGALSASWPPAGQPAS
ncbi:hypothetical protein [Streptomyces prasinus]|uniref:hypothetical protein n=1 Tax=Streptomyces prasinus TaxID=67345 RepID=UPI0033B38102